MKARRSTNKGGSRRVSSFSSENGSSRQHRSSSPPFLYPRNDLPLISPTLSPPQTHNRSIKKIQPKSSNPESKKLRRPLLPILRIDDQLDRFLRVGNVGSSSPVSVRAGTVGIGGGTGRAFVAEVFGPWEERERGNGREGEKVSLGLRKRDGGNVRRRGRWWR